MDKFEKLYNELNDICKTYRTNTWTNSWMWSNLGRMGMDNKLKYYFLITIGYEEVTYTDINDYKITIRFNGNPYYRIDINDRYDKNHYYWRFKVEDWFTISSYIKYVVENQYKSLTNKYKIHSLCEGANYNDKPKKVYEFMKKKLREEKIKRINET